MERKKKQQGRNKSASQDSKKPRKKPRKKTKKATKRSADNTSSTSPSMSSSMASLSALFRFAEDPRAVQHKQQLDALCGSVQEYLDNFILVGYTLNGHPVQITYGRTCKDYDSLNTALHKYIIDNYIQPPPPPGQFQ